MYENSSDYFKQNIDLENYEKKVVKFMLDVHKENAPIINKEILNLPNPVTLNDKETILNLRKRYNQLDDVNQKTVNYIYKLTCSKAATNLVLSIVAFSSSVKDK